jgi:transposase
MARSTRRSWLTARRPLCKPLSAVAWLRRSSFHSDGWRGYDGLVDVGYAKHYRVHHGQHEFVRGNSQVNGIESFWSYARSRLHQFHGISPEKFYLRLQECEYRFNLRKNNVYAELLKLLRKYPL